MTDENQTQPSTPNPYEVYRRYVEEQNRIWLNWWTEVLKNVWGIKK